MNLGELIQNNQTASLTLIGAIFGAMITQGANLISKYIDHKNILKTKKFDLAVELEKKYLIEPLIDFIDKELKSIQKIYTKIFEKDDPENIKVNYEHVDELTLIEARVDGLGDPNLSSKFKEFSRCRIIIGTRVADKRNNESFEELEKAKKLAADILKILFDKLKNA